MDKDLYLVFIYSYIFSSIVDFYSIVGNFFRVIKVFGENLFEKDNYNKRNFMYNLRFYGSKSFFVFLCVVFMWYDVL